uniref:Uncharacterized protein n=1 Tax=Meloidogyne enterolobii TaxID=390850 RepID=A0A6V7U363_MELEN|nr:unnamed protein product [Meloidogyne enterolobii]
MRQSRNGAASQQPSVDYGPRPRLHRKQSIRRTKYKKTPKARINDIPNVAQPDEMFDGGVCKSKSELHKEIDPYIDSETGMLPKCTDQLSDSSISSSQVSSASTIRAASPSKRKPKATTTTNRQPKKAKQKRQPTMLVSSAATVAILQPPSPVGEREELFEGLEQQKHHHHRSASPILDNKFNKIRRQLRVALLKRNEGQKKASGESVDSSDADDEEEDDDEEEEEEEGKSYAYSSISSMSTEAAGNEEGFDCCVQLWNILVKIVRLMFEAGNYVLDHKLLFYPLAIIFAYLCLGVLHSIFASILASVAGWIWPPLHFILSTTGGFVWRLADWLFWVDELGRSLICDMAASYCRRYRLLCDRQCSFVDRAVEHSHGHRAF